MFIRYRLLIVWNNIVFKRTNRNIVDRIYATIYTYNVFIGWQTGIVLYNFIYCFGVITFDILITHTVHSYVIVGYRLEENATHGVVLRGRYRNANIRRIVHRYSETVH